MTVSVKPHPWVWHRRVKEYGSKLQKKNLEGRALKQFMVRLFTIPKFWHSMQLLDFKTCGLCLSSEASLQS